MQGCAICEVVKLINKKKHYITNTIIHHRNKMVAHHTQWQMSWWQLTQLAMMENSCTFATNVIQTKKTLGMQHM